MLLIEEDIVDAVLSAIEEVGEFEKPGTGIAFTVRVDEAVGLENQLGAGD